MDTVLDILQALGIGAAVGIRPFLPALLVGALAAADLGLDFDGTDWAFLEEPAFLVVMIVGVVLMDLVRRRAGDERLEAGVTAALLAAIAGAIALLEGAGSLDDRGGPVVAGMLAGLVGAFIAVLAIPPVFARVRTRLGTEAGLLPLYREALGLVAAGLSVLFPPLALVIVGGLLFLLAGGRRREGEKYAGLRILR